MSESIDKPKRPRHAGQFQPGNNANPKGRPRSGTSLAEAMRERFPPERIVELAERLATAAESEQVRLAALQLIAERAHGKVATDVTLTTTMTNAPTLDLTRLPLDDQRRLLAAIRAARAAALPVGEGDS